MYWSVTARVGWWQPCTASPTGWRKSPRGPSGRLHRAQPHAIARDPHAKGGGGAPDGDDGLERRGAALRNVGTHESNAAAEHLATAVHGLGSDIDVEHVG